MFQVGANVGETISVSLTTDVTTAAVGTLNTVSGVAYAMDTVTADGTADTVLTFTPAGGTGSDVNIAAGATIQEAADAINNANIEGVAAFVNAGGFLQVLSDDPDVAITEVVGGAGNVTGLAGLTTIDEAADGTITTAESLAGLGVDTVANANFAIARIDSALTAVNGLRGNLGAIQNRFESTIVNLQTVSENLAASRGRIQDADFAAETAALTKAQILQQAGIAMLAQANQLPQNVLQLLG